MKYYIPILVIAGLLAYILFLPSTTGTSNVDILEADIPSGLILINDYIYYIGMDEDLHKLSKVSLSEIDHLHIPGSRNLEYSEYYDMIMVAVPGVSSTIHLVDYEQMSFNDSFLFDNIIVGMRTYGDNLYLIYDESGVMEDDLYSMGDLDSHTGKLVECSLPEMHSNWEAAVGTMPEYFDICEDYIVVSAEEHDLIVDDSNEAYMNANIVNIVNKNTQEVREFIVGLNVWTHIECGGNGKVYISNPNYACEYFIRPTFGMSVIDLNTMEIEHIHLEHPLAGDKGWGVFATQVVGAELYMSFFTGGADKDKTYFGIYDLISEELEVTEIPGVDQNLTYLVVDGNCVYFLTYDGWLIKYTMD